MLKRLDEAAAKAIGPSGYGREHAAMRAMEARKAILAEIEAMGWQIVPKVPTAEWVKRAEAFAEDGNSDLYNYPAEDGFKAMIATTAERQRLRLCDTPPHADVDAMVEVAARAIVDARNKTGWHGAIYDARAALESLGIPLSVLAAIRAGEWVAVPKVATGEMLAAARQYDYAGMIVHDPDQDDWAAHLSAAPKTPEAAR